MIIRWNQYLYEETPRENMKRKHCKVAGLFLNILIPQRGQIGPFPTIFVIHHIGHNEMISYKPYSLRTTMLLHCWTDGMVAVSRTLETVGVLTARYNLPYHSCRGFVMRVIILLIF